MNPDPINQSTVWRLVLTILTAILRCLQGGVLLYIALPVYAQQLPVRHYDVADGLAHSYVGVIHQDRKGYIWFGTREGLSRFDGYRFTNYGIRDGLGHIIVNAIVEDLQGQLWVGTNGGGVSRLIDDPGVGSPSFYSSKSATKSRPKFISYRVGDSPLSNQVNSLLFDSTGTLWCTTDVGVYRATPGRNKDLKFTAVAIRNKIMMYMPAFTDRHKRNWFGVGNELLEIVQGKIIKYEQGERVAYHNITGIVEDLHGRLLVTNQREVFEFIEPKYHGNPGSWKHVPLSLTPNQTITTIKVDTQGTLWIGTVDGLIKYRNGKQTLYTTSHGLSNKIIRSLTEDRDGNLWIGTEAGGVCKFSGELIVNIVNADGQPYQHISRVIEGRNGRIYASIVGTGLIEIVDGKAISLNGSTLKQFTTSFPYQDNRENWWINTLNGLYLSKGPDLQLLHSRKLTADDGIPADRINASSTVAENKFGKLWIRYWNDQNIYYLDNSRTDPGVFARIPLNIPLSDTTLIMMSDSYGSLWIGGHTMLARWMRGKTKLFQTTEGLPETQPRFFFQDSRGWVWIGLRYSGVSMTKDPDAESPKFINYSTETGLASNTIWSITEDDMGRIYLGTSKGLDQFDPLTKRIRHFNTRNGLAGDLINYCFKDQSGNVWVATTLGLSKFNPRAERTVSSFPQIYFNRVQVAGEDLLIEETGTRIIPKIELSAQRNNLLIEYVALSYYGEHQLRYQYKLEGIDSDWSAPSEGRSVNYARLAPGSYRFMARAINRDGLISSEPAMFDFQIMPPIWQRWWFLVITSIVVGGVSYLFYRYRLIQHLKLERMRIQIATDLHDDIGTNLTRISILSEVAQQQSASNIQSTNRWLLSIADIARESVSSINDIIWAINPKNDKFMDLMRKMRQHAEEIFTLRDIEVKFSVPVDNRDFRIDVNVRRDLYLIFKESVNNAVRHSGCSIIAIDLNIEGGQLKLTIHDNGQGFDPEALTEGNGLHSMHRRAAALGGKLSIESQASEGTRLRLTMMLTRLPLSTSPPK